MALVDDKGREIKTKEAHVELGGADGERPDVDDGDRVVVTDGKFKGEQGTVLSTDLLDDGIEVRLDDGDVIKTEEGHVSPVRR